AGVQIQTGEDLRDRYRMGDIRLAAAAVLALVRLGPEIVRLDDAFDIRGGKIGGQARQQLTEAVVVNTLDGRKPLFSNRAAYHQRLSCRAHASGKFTLPPAGRRRVTLRCRAAGGVTKGHPESAAAASRARADRRRA